MRKRRILLAVLVLLVVAGLGLIGVVAVKGSGPTQLPPIEEYQPRLDHYEIHEQNVRNVAHSLGIEDELPSIDYEVVEWGDPEVHGDVIADCMKQEGFRLESDGSSYSWMTPADQQDSLEFKVALVRCEGTYPVRGDISAPFTVTERWYWSGLLHSELEPCLIDSGLDRFRAPNRLLITLFVGERYDPVGALHNKHPEQSTDFINSALISCQTQMSDVRIRPS